MEDKRKQWIDAMCKIVTPVLDMLEHGKLKQSLPLTFHEERKVFAPLEAFGRSMLGLAPWLETDSETLDEEERTRQAVYRQKPLVALRWQRIQSLRILCCLMRVDSHLSMLHFWRMHLYVHQRHLRQHFQRKQESIWQMRFEAPERFRHTIPTGYFSPQWWRQDCM